MTVNPMVSLASSVHAGPGTFALLLGSGISVNAGVPSGWGVMIELIRRLALLRNQDAGDDPVSWYREQFGTEPDYSTIIEGLAPSQAARLTLVDPDHPVWEDLPENAADRARLAYRTLVRLQRRHQGQCLQCPWTSTGSSCQR